MINPLKTLHDKIQAKVEARADEIIAKASSKKRAKSKVLEIKKSKKHDKKNR